MIRKGALRDILRVVRGDLPFHLFVLLYGIAALALALSLGRPEKMLALIYARRFIPFTLGVGALYLGWVALHSLRTDRPLAEMNRRLAERFTPRFVANLLLFVNVAVFYGIFTSFKRMLADLRDYTYDEEMADVDRLIHGADPWTLFDYSPGLTRVIQFFYLHGWLTSLVLMTFYVVMFCPRPLVQRFVWTFYLAWILLGNILAGIFMSAGPVYYRFVTGSDRFEPLLDHMEFSSRAASSSVRVQDVLWSDYLFDLGRIGSGISAFPSLHVAMATLWALAAFAISRRLFVFFVLVLIGVQFSSVYLGWHYAIDGYFSIIFVLGLWAMVGAMTKFRAMSPKLRPEHRPRRI